MSKLMRLVVVGLMTGAVSVASANEKPAVESFFGEPDVSFATLSPSGRYVAMLVHADGKPLLAVRDTADLAKVSGVATIGQSRIYDVHWINENRIGFTLKDPRLDFRGNLEEVAVDRDGSNLIQLISGNWQHHQDASTGSRLTSKVLTAEYGYFGRTHDGSDDIIVQKYIWNHVDTLPESSRLYRLNTRTSRLDELLPGKQPTRVKRWLLDSESRPRIAVTEAKGRCAVWYRKADGADWSEIGNHDCYDDAGFTPLFFDSNNTLYVRAGYKGANALFQYDLDKRELGKRPFVDVAGFDFTGSIVQDYVAKKILGVRLLADAEATEWLDPAMKAIQQKVDALLPGTVNRIDCGDCANPPAVLVSAQSDRQPLSYYVYTPANGKLIGLGSSHPGIKPAQMGRRAFYRFAARDGLQIPVYVTMPPGKEAAQLPTVLLVHGGPYMRGGSWEWDEEAQFLASRGYVVLQPEFRGSTGFGYEHFRAGWKQWGRAMQDDLADTVAWAAGKGWSDPKRVAIMGASYGGYAALMGMIRDPGLYRCGVEWAGVTDLDLLLTSMESDLSEEARRYDMRTLVGDPKDDALQFTQFSPLKRASGLKQPLLIAHGTEDKRVPIEHATRFYSAVKTQNPNVEWVEYADEGHGWHLEENRFDFWKRVEAFLAKNLAP